MLCCAAYYAPALVRRLLLRLRGKRRGAGADGDADNASMPLLPSGGASPGPAASAAEAGLRAQLARASDEVARLQALAFSSATGASAVPEALAAAARLLGGRGAGGGANAAPLWDRREFVQATAAHCSLLLQLLDEHLVDALAAAGGAGGGGGGGGGGAQASSAQHPAEVVTLAAALHLLLSKTAAQAAATVAERRDAVAASSMGLPGAPAAGSAEAALLAQWAASAPFAAFFRAALELSWAAGAIDFAGTADAVVVAWTRALCAARGGGAAAAALERALAASAVREALRRAVALHLRLAVWPSIVQSGLVWGVRAGGGAPEPTALDSAAHVLFSASGRALGEGAAVLFVGPELTGDLELRTRGNRALVFAA